MPWVAAARQGGDRAAVPLAVALRWPRVGRGALAYEAMGPVANGGPA